MSAHRTPAPWWRLPLQVALFFTTFLTTTAAGAFFVHPGSYWPIADGLSFSVPLLLILLCHELGHYFAARFHGVDASLPYFIPLPPFLGLFGTMGAVIGMKDTTRDRRKLIDIGAAGPLAGIVVAIPVIVYGLQQSTVVPLVSGGLQEGNSILYAVCKRLVKGTWLPGGGQDVFLHPTAWAGWAGLLVTMVNLLPIWQLDGGHVAAAYFGDGYGRKSRWLHRALPMGALAVFGWAYVTMRGEAPSNVTSGTVLLRAAEAASPWFFWFVLLTVVSRLAGGLEHPPVDERPLPPSRRALFWIVAAVLALIFMPVPLRTTLEQPPPKAASQEVRR